MRAPCSGWLGACWISLPHPVGGCGGPWGAVLGVLTVIMFLCAWRLPSFRPRVMPSRASANQIVAGLSRVRDRVHTSARL